VKGTLHWVSAQHAIEGEVRLFDRLFMSENPDVKILNHCKFEPGLKNVTAGDKFQFQRIGYFSVDPDTTPGKPVFNRTVPLRDSWTKKSGK